MVFGASQDAGVALDWLSMSTRLGPLVWGPLVWGALGMGLLGAAVAVVGWARRGGSKGAVVMIAAVGAVVAVSAPAGAGGAVPVADYRLMNTQEAAVALRDAYGVSIAPGGVEQIMTLNEGIDYPGCREGSSDPCPPRGRQLVVSGTCDGRAVECAVWPTWEDRFVVVLECTPAL